MIARIGRAAIDGMDEFLYAMGFFARVLRESVLLLRRGQVGRRVLVNQILFTGIDALGITAAMALAIGAAINLIGSSLLAGFGQGKLMYTLLIIVITRELGPLLTAFVIIARSGTALATELGGMAVGHEIEAYVSFGIDPISYLVVPRVMGMMLSMLFLNLYFNCFGLLGSFVVIQFVKPIGVYEYFRPLFAALTWGDLSIGILKSVVFGAIVSIVSTFQGFSVQRAS